MFTLAPIRTLVARGLPQSGCGAAAAALVEGADAVGKAPQAGVGPVHSLRVRCSIVADRESMPCRDPGGAAADPPAGPAGEPTLSIRPMEMEDFAIRVTYFHAASDEQLARLGVERSRLPEPEAWRASFARNLALPLAERTEYGLVWELDGALVGFGTADRIEHGEAHMHLHIVDPARRAAGLGRGSCASPPPTSARPSR